MPSSSTKGKREIFDWFIEQEGIKTIVDVGCGSGTYPKLLGKKYYWIGVEIFERYVEQFSLNSIYNEVILGDILNVDLPEADCIIFGDVLEHLEKHEAVGLIKKANEKYGHIVISIPLEYYQGEYMGNIYEIHKSIWTWEELLKVIPESFMRVKFDNIAVFIK